jgi:hypothetical protein
MPKPTVKIQSLGHVATAALLAGAFSTPALAQPASYIYSGGATFPEKVYRDIMNCYGDSSGGDLEANLVAGQATCNGQAGYTESGARPPIQVLYLGVGSGNGLAAWRTNVPADLTNGPRTPDNPPVPASADSGAFYGTGTGAGWVPNTTDTGPFFPDYSFSGSDDPISTANLATYDANKVAGGWGNAIQLPSMVGPVGIPYRPAPGTWTEAGVSVAGNASKLKFSTDTWCGIFSGAINDWNDPEITADNGGVSLTGGNPQPITVVYRSDGSGTTFIMANAFINQCATSAHPVPMSWQTADPPGSNINVAGQSNNNWFINVQNDPVIDLPANFVGAPGNGGNLKNTLPDATGPRTASLQTYASFIAGGAVVWKAPTSANASKIMLPVTGDATTLYLKAPSFAKNCATLPQGCATNPLDWGKTNPTPKNVNAWPIGGFTFFDMYTCYSSAAEVNDLFGTTAGQLGFIRWYFGTTTENGTKVKNSLTKNGFAVVPGSYMTAAKKLTTTNAPTKVGVAGDLASVPCAGVAGPGA